MYLYLDTTRARPTVFCMPYDWISSASNTTKELHLWPHQSLPLQGYVAILAMAAILTTVPLLPVLGSMALWGVFPFVLVALFGLKWALDRNRQDQQVLEILKLDTKNIHLEHQAPRQKTQTWDCNRYWATVKLHKDDGPVPNYLTLRGNGREVEIGAFLSEEERIALYGDLKSSLSQHCIASD